MKRHHLYDGNSTRRPLFRLIIPPVPYPNVFSHIAMPPLGALYVATAAKEHGLWDVEVIDGLNWRSGVSRRELAKDPFADHRDLQARRPARAVGFYAGLTSTVPRVFELAQLYRSLGVRTIAGGAHVDALPREALESGIDIVVHGEGEETIKEVLDAWSAERPIDGIRGISFLDPDSRMITTESRGPICDLDNLPIPDFDLLVEKRRSLTIAPFERTRGCSFSCEFCVVHDRFGPSRSKSPERVALELEKRVDSGFRQFFCVDDNFIQGRKGTMNLLGLICDLQKRKRVRLNLTIQARSSVGRDEELMQAMRSAGIEMIAVGLESPIGEELEEMAKHQTPEQIESDVRNMRRHGFMIHGMFIFGYPLEGSLRGTGLTLRERADRYLSFIRRTRLDTIQVLKPVPVPGSRLAERLARQKRILPLDVVGWDKYDGNYLTFLPDLGISATELQKQANRIMRRFYSRLSFLKFPLLVLETPVEILRMGFQRAGEFARSRADLAQAGNKERVRHDSALRAGFREAGSEIARRWRDAFFRTLGSHVVTVAFKTGGHSKFLAVLTDIQAVMRQREEKTAGTSGA